MTPPTTIAQLRAQTTQDLTTCARLRDDPTHPLPDLEQDLDAARRASRDTARRIEGIYDSGPESSTDREMLQVLNARLVACDRLVQVLVEMGGEGEGEEESNDVEVEGEGGASVAGSWKLGEGSASQWPLLYQILDVDPSTDERQWDAVVRM
ncbi:hypothetical protein Tdes44962_MAKER04669 [Teratosphaeria destructans]|uniref:Uncharacterized protein n=1 Tax=Teratosphaeria destructans TaxID=418781 RepID=A0A9W7W025_9PEZI|nr:hypothetical protein Tdes44962_MAKER04669 [Teratosphaeria destructans]